MCNIRQILKQSVVVNEYRSPVRLAYTCNIKRCRWPLLNQRYLIISTSAFVTKNRKSVSRTPTKVSQMKFKLGGYRYRTMKYCACVFFAWVIDGIIRRKSRDQDSNELQLVLTRCLHISMLQHEKVWHRWHFFNPSCKVCGEFEGDEICKSMDCLLLQESKSLAFIHVQT